MPHEHPDPLVPAEVDLTDFKFMPLEVSRLLRSEFWINAMDTDARIAAASVNLWAESWHQRPAASLPDSDAVLSRLAMVDRAVWREIRDAVMEPWTICSDGRWYHPVVSEKANAAWAEKMAYQERKRRWKEAGQKGGQKRAESQDQATLEATLEARLEATLEATPQPKVESVSVRGEGKSKGLTDLKKKEHIPDADAPGADLKGPKGEGYTPEFEEFWKVYPRKDEKGTAFRAFKTAIKLVSFERLMESVRVYAAQKRADPTFIKHGSTWLNGHCWNDEQPPAAAKPKRGSWYVPMGNGG